MKTLLFFLIIGARINAQPKMNLVFSGDSLTQGVPHLNGETDTYPFKVSQQFRGSTYVKLGYPGQPTDYLMVHLDAFLFGLIDVNATNVLVVWGGTNDCALEPLPCVQPAYTRLRYIANTAHAAGWWKVVAVTMIARDSQFIDSQHQQQFAQNQAALNKLMLNSSAFDAVADPSQRLNDPTSAYFYDGVHLNPSGYQIVANAVAQAIQSLASAKAGKIP
jgi:lysophospholipase L1-like esterase